VTTIVAIHADKVLVPFQRPFPTSAGMWLAREAWILRLVDADGRVGVGEAVLEPQDGETAATVLDHLVRELAARRPSDGLPTTQELEIHGSPGRALRAAIDAARFDLGLLDLGLSALEPDPPGDDDEAAGGIPVNATLALLGPDASAEAARQAVSAGFTTLKLKAGGERETEVLVDRVRAVRAAVGREVELRLDINGAWDLDTASERLDAVARFGLEYVEQPLAGDDPAALAELRRRVGVPLAADETVTSVRAARLLLDADAVDALVVKPVRVGGIAAAAEIAEVAAERGVPVVVSTLFETGVGIAAGLAVAATLPDVRGGRLDHLPDHGLATAGLLEHDLLADGLILQGGLLWAPGGDGAGRLGVRIDERALARYAADRAAGPAWEAWEA
jgi:L-alanine-DL-glutamate epimerase-like enolase superfamily enzyme